MFVDGLGNVADQIKVDMIGWIEQRRLIADPFCRYPPNIFLSKGMAYFNLQITWEAMLAIRTIRSKNDRSFVFAIFDRVGPFFGFKPRLSAVQGMSRCWINRYLIVLASKCKVPIFDSASCSTN